MASEIPRGNMQRKNFASYFKEYCDFTGIHGLRYIVEDRTFVEKAWWICCLILSMIFCGLMVYDIFNKYLNHPIYVTFSMQESRIQEIPFPAVTICPRAKFSMSYFNLTEMILKNESKTISTNEEKLLNIASTLCEFYSSSRNNKNAKEEDFYDLLFNAQFPILVYCYYLRKERNCSEIFTPILTEEGICYSFNILDRDDIFHDFVEFKYPNFHKIPFKTQWNIEEGYLGRNVTVYPGRALRIGAKDALFIVLKTKKHDVESDCSADESGYRVTLNLPSEIPNVAENYINVPLDQRVNGVIKPNVIKTSRAVKKFKIETRDCYFQFERKLKFFKIYNKENCILECKANHTLKICGCVGHYMPKTSGTPTCILDNIVCMEEIEESFVLYNEGLEVGEKEIVGKHNISNCDCRPTCTDISYNLELSHNSFRWKPNTKEGLEMTEKDTYYSIVNLYFRKSYAETKEKTEVYGFSDVISNFGGLLGLFTGFSILSFAEVIYFLSLRIWGNIKLYGNWHGNGINSK